ncbi:response regulator [Pseudomonas sp. R2.Fl]|nr:response regulator [Pseudomonas sp. R2.Fl]
MTDFAKASAVTTDPTVATATGLQASLLDAMSEALGIAFIVLDGNDHIVHSCREIRRYFPVPPQYLTPGTRLRDFLGAIYDQSAGRDGAGEVGGRDEWIAQSIAAHWRERSDSQEKDAQGRWLRFARRRLPSGYGLCMVSDITEQKKREEQWRADIERVQLTEEILDNLPYPICVYDRDLTLVAVNRSFCVLRNASAEALLGTTAASVFEALLAGRLEAACRHTLETGVPSSREERMVGRNGGWATVTIRNQRVGKPGRYFVVSSFDERSAFGPNTSAVAGVGEGRGWGAGPFGGSSATSEQPPSTTLAGRKVVIVTGDPSFEASCTKVLAAMGAESCSVRNAHETEAFFDVASSVGIRIDIAIVDTQMDLACLELAECHASAVLTLDSFQIATELPARLAARGAEVPPAAGDEWQVSAGGEPAGRPRQRQVQVLVAEDNPINQIVFSQILEGLGYGYRIVDRGDEAVRLWEELHPHVVLMDLTLPGLNGIEAVREIRERDRRLGYGTPIVGVLVQAFDSSREDCLAAGMNDAIVKPVSPDMVEVVFRRLAPDMVANPAS